MWRITCNFVNDFFLNWKHKLPETNVIFRLNNFKDSFSNVSITISNNPLVYPRILQINVESIISGFVPSYGLIRALFLSLADFEMRFFHLLKRCSLLVKIKVKI